MSRHIPDKAGGDMRDIANLSHIKKVFIDIVACGQLGLARALFEDLKDTDIPLELRKTNVIHIAARRNDVEMLELLRDHGFDLRIIHHGNGAPLLKLWADFHGNQKLLDLYDNSPIIKL